MPVKGVHKEKDRENRIKAEQQAFDELNKSLQVLLTTAGSTCWIKPLTTASAGRRVKNLAWAYRMLKTSLATEQKVQTEAEQKETNWNEKARAELEFLPSNHTAHVENGDKNAVAATIKDIVMLSAFIQSCRPLPGFSENTGTGGGWMERWFLSSRFFI